MPTQNLASVLGGAGGTNLLPRNVSNKIWNKAQAQSIIPTLATSEPMILGENSYPMVTKRPSASIVGEGQQKPQSQVELGAKMVKPIKAVVGLEFTLESILANPSGILGLLESEMSGALARQVDLAILHGRDASTGNAIAGAEYVNQTTNRVELTTPNNADAELWAGYGLVVDGATGADFTGFAFDPRMIGVLANARNAQTGQRLNPDIQMGSAVSSYAGQKVAVSKTVSGQVDASADTKVRAFGGDWDALRFGRVLDIRTKKIEYGDPFGNGDLQGRNCIAYLAEVFFGWAILDLSAFAAYEDQVAEGA
ncbi:phage major capsid protein [Propionibacteriaceae bacterium Y1700]|uniref:phage major capsid protein n=1 Tax=Microlunatus sp. Y1700 TaxID=3418487 RepID=UPI003DA6F1A2